MDLNFFENDIFCQNFNINLNKIIWRFFNYIFKNQEYSINISPQKSQKWTKSKWMWLMLSHLHPTAFKKIGQMFHYIQFNIKWMYDYWVSRKSNRNDCTIVFGNHVDTMESTPITWDKNTYVQIVSRHDYNYKCSCVSRATHFSLQMKPLGLVQTFNSTITPKVLCKRK